MSSALEIARGEIGTRESPANSNNVKYNTWYYGRAVSGDAYPWCVTFVQWCFARSGTQLPCKTASCSALLSWYKDNLPDRVQTSPRPGDVVIYNFGHAGIVESAGGGTVTAIEGNTSGTSGGSQSNGGGVFRRTRKTSLVTAYIRPAAASAAAAEPETEKEDENDMTGEQIYKALQEYCATLEVPDWAADELAEAKAAGVTDATNAMQFIPRYQAAIMAKRAKEG